MKKKTFAKLDKDDYVLNGTKVKEFFYLCTID